MKYIFGFLANINIYKKDFNLRIFSDNTLIDDIDFTESITSEHKIIENAEYNRFTNYYLSAESQKRWRDWGMESQHGIELVEGGKYPKQIFVYELNDQVLGSSLSFQFNNMDTNYTNGFMTKSATMQLLHTFLLPKDFLRMDKLQDLENRFDKERDPAWLIDPWPWPGTSGYYESVNGKVIDRSHMPVHGGKQKLILPIVKKHGIHMIGRLKGGDEPHDFTTKNSIGKIIPDPNFYKICYWYKLLNIYNEDTRNHHA